MRITVLVLIMLVAVAFLGSALAVPPGKTIEYQGGAMGKVVFDGAKHMKAGLKCNDCHTAIFAMKTGEADIKAPHEPGTYCATCHDGSRAFNQSENCARCHVK